MRQNDKPGEPLRRRTGAVIWFEMSDRSVEHMSRIFEEIQRDDIVDSVSVEESIGQWGHRYVVTLTATTHGNTRMTPMTILDRARRRASADERGHILFGSAMLREGWRIDVPRLCQKDHGAPCESCLRYIG